MSTRIHVEIELANGVQPTLFNQAMAAALETNPAVSSWSIDCADDESDWTEDELAQLVTLGDKTQISVEETRHLYLRISAHLKIPVRKQELALFEFLCVSPTITGQKELHKRISCFCSAIFGEVVFEDSRPKILTALYSKLRRKLEDTTAQLVGRRGVYGFKSSWRPVQGKESRARKPSALLDPAVDLDQAIADMGDED